VGGGQRRLTVVPTNPVLSSSSTIKTFTAARRRPFELVPGKKVVWHVLDSRIGFVKDKTEWKGTDMVFEIIKKDDQTELRFTHVRLVPAIECYGDCSGAWGSYINGSLRSLLTTGKGHPNQKEKRDGEKACL
jgi:hypothetical protein